MGGAGPVDGQIELVVLDLPASPAYVGVARTVVATVASSMDGAGGRVDDLRVAVSEACTNAIEAHAGSDARVVLRCCLHGRELEVRVEDTAGGIDPSRLPRRGTMPSIDPPAERGWGIGLIRALVDEVEFAPHGRGTSVRMVVNLDEPA